jgi:predicted nuclease of predicted toxin-antitoxin system
LKFLVDMPLSPNVVSWLVGLGHDALHAATIGLSQAADAVVIERARADERIIITADLDYPRLLALSGADRPGVILFRGGDWSDDDIVVRLSSLFATLPEQELVRSLVVVERARIRRRALPV